MRDNRGGAASGMSCAIGRLRDDVIEVCVAQALHAVNPQRLQIVERDHHLVTLRVHLRHRFLRHRDGQLLWRVPLAALSCSDTKKLHAARASF